MAALEWEELLVSMSHELPQPVKQEPGLDGAVILVGGDPADVVVRLTRSSAVVSEFAVDWEGPHEPVTRPIRFGSLRWRQLDSAQALLVLNTLILAARESRRAKYRTCRFCESVKPPEWMHADDVCQACAETRLGVRY
jgi:hypothetical protein